MKIVVTGGSGRLGQHVVQELLGRGHEVLSLDRVESPTKPCPSWITDLTRSGDVYQALKGADGVIHLAAHQAPNLVADSETFSNNVVSTYNVLKAASDLGVRRVVLASSVAAYGFTYAPRLWPPEYLPLDERHPCKPQDPYGLSKVVGEQTANSFAEQGNMAISSLRLAGINFDLSYETFPERWQDPGGRRVGGFWSYVDARDASVACRLALEATFTGHKAFNVAAPTSSMREPTHELVRRYVPGAPRVKEGLSGNWSGVDSTKARSVLGFKAEHVWERYIPVEAH